MDFPFFKAPLWKKVLVVALVALGIYLLLNGDKWVNVDLDQQQERLRQMEVEERAHSR